VYDDQNVQEFFVQKFLFVVVQLISDVQLILQIFLYFLLLMMVEEFQVDVEQVQNIVEVFVQQMLQLLYGKFHL
jgi:hypothetical protein